MESLPPKDTKCHRTGFEKTCRECVVDHGCQLWQQLMGQNPQTGEMVNKWGCADAFTNMLLIENSQQQRQTGAAVESLRNEVVEMNNETHLLPARRLLRLEQNNASQ